MVIGSVAVGIVAGVICFFAAYAIGRIAPAMGLIDFPDRNRKLHSRPIAVGGGIAVFAGFWAAILLATIIPGPWRGELQAESSFLLILFALTLLTVGIGVLDDRIALRGRQKLVLQIVMAMILIVGGIAIERVRAFGWEIELQWLVAPAAVFWFLLTVNSINFLDGMDGVATTVTGILCMALSVIAFWQGQPTNGVLLLTLAGSLAGFLGFNLPPARIYLGDAGSMLLGALAGTLTLRTIEPHLSIFVALGLWTLPFVDVTAAVVRRNLTGRSAFSSDRGHLHHRLAQRFQSPWATLGCITCLSLAISSLVLASVYFSFEPLAFFGPLLLVGGLALTGLFGRAELRLICHKVTAFWPSLIFRRGPRLTRHQATFQLQGAYPWQSVWDDFLISIEKLELSLVQLDVNMPWIHESFYGIWRRSPTNARILWRVELPLACRGRVCGRLIVAGQQDSELAPVAVSAVCEHLQSLISFIFDAQAAAPRRSPKAKSILQRKPRVVFVNRSYWPDAESTGQLLTELCEDLAGDFETEVIAGRPNANPSGVSFRPWGTCVREGATIHRVWHTRFAKNGFLSRLANQATFFIAAGIRCLCTRSPDVIILQTDPPFLYLWGPLLKRWHGAEIIIYLHDIYPDVAIALGWLGDNWLTKTLRKRMFRALGQADRVVVVGRDMQRFLESEGLAKGRAVNIPNWTDTSIEPAKTSNPFRRENRLDDKFIVMYSGNMGLCHALEDIVAAAARLRERTDIAFLFVGEGVKKAALQQECTRLDLTTVHFLPYQPKENLRWSLSAADLHLVTIDSRISSFIMPSKLYGALASETPVLAVGPLDCELVHVVESEGVGLVAPPHDPARIAAQILWCADHQDELREMGRRARLLAVHCYDRHKSTRRFAELLRDVSAATSAEPALEDHMV